MYISQVSNSHCSRKLWPTIGKIVKFSAYNIFHVGRQTPTGKPNNHNGFKQQTNIRYRYPWYIHGPQILYV